MAYQKPVVQGARGNDLDWGYTNANVVTESNAVVGSQAVVLAAGAAIYFAVALAAIVID